MRASDRAFYDVYEALIEVMMAIDDAGLTNDPRALRLRTILARMSMAIELKDDAAARDICKVIQDSLRP